jgi:diguanylate cyclase
VSYAVRFEYVAQANAPLRKAVDEHLARGGVLDEFATHALFKRHVADVDPETAQRVVDDMQRMLGRIGDAAGHAGTHAARFGESLARLAGALELGDTSRGMGDPSRDIAQARTLSSVVADVIADTGTMRSQLGGLVQRLAESRREIERLREEVRRSREEALRDSLTGLANRRAFDQALAACLGAPSDDAQAWRAPTLLDARATRSESTPPSASRPPDSPSVAPDADGAHSRAAATWLLLSDIDDFRGINEAYGSAFGDQVLKTVAGALASIATRGGTLARIGGDAFALLLPELDAPTAQALADRVRRDVGSSRIRRAGHEKDEHVTVSVGLASHRAGESAQAFFERADRALLTAKHGANDGLVRAD